MVRGAAGRQVAFIRNLVPTCPRRTKWSGPDGRVDLSVDEPLNECALYTLTFALSRFLQVRLVSVSAQLFPFDPCTLSFASDRVFCRKQVLTLYNWFHLIQVRLFSLVFAQNSLLTNQSLFSVLCKVI